MTQTDSLSRSGNAAPPTSFDAAMSMAPAVYDLSNAWSLDGAQLAVTAPCADENNDASGPEPVAVSRRRVSDAATRVGRRSRLRAAHVEAVSRAEAEGRALDVGRQTNEFMAAMRADIA